MLILKSYIGQKIVFDTETKDKSIENIDGGVIPMHHFHDTNDYDFLLIFFDKNHEIFEKFSSSYFYVTNK